VDLVSNAQNYISFDSDNVYILFFCFQGEEAAVRAEYTHIWKTYEKMSNENNLLEFVYDCDGLGMRSKQHVKF